MTITMMALFLNRCGLLRSFERMEFVVGGRVVFWGLKLRVYYDIIILKYNLV